MHKRTVAFLKQAKGAPLFVHVGEPLADRAVDVVPDWDTALKAWASTTWVNLGVLARNHLFAETIAAWGQHWYDNDFGRDLDFFRAEVRPWLRRMLRPLVQRHKLPKTLEQWVIGEFVMICVENEYADVLTVDFYRKLAPWYLAGRFPCGWSGKLPREPKSTGKSRLPALPRRGKLIVF